MRRLNTKNVCPPDGYRYLHPETGHLTRAMDWWTWVEQAKDHRKANNLSIPNDFVAQMEDQLCNTIGPDWCQYEKDDSQAWVNLRIGPREVVDFTKVLIEHAKNREFVSQEEADRRAKICASCYANVFVSGCGICSELASLVIGNRSTQYDQQLQSCGVCKCVNKCQVHFSLQTLEVNDNSEKQSLYPKEFCWKSRQSPNYQST